MNERRWRLVRAGRSAVPASVRRFNRRARQRRLRAAAPWASATGVLALAGLLAWLVYGTSVLGVREVRVTGVEILTAPQVAEAAAVPAGTPLARVDLDAVRRRVAVLPPAGEVTVVRDWPGTLWISVTERAPVAAVPKDRQFLLVDRSGLAFHAVARRPADLPLVRLADPRPEDSTTRAALTVLAALTPPLLEQMVELTADAPTRIRLLLTGGRTVIWGDATENDTKAKVVAVLLPKPGKEIDVSAPEVVTVR